MPTGTDFTAQQVLSRSFDEDRNVIRVRQTIDGVSKFALINASASGNTVIVAAQGAGTRIRVTSYLYVVEAAVDVAFRSGSTTVRAGPMPHDGKGQGVTPSDPGGLFETDANEALNINLSGAVIVRGHLTYSVTT